MWCKKAKLSNKKKNSKYTCQLVIEIDEVYE